METNSVCEKYELVKVKGTESINRNYARYQIRALKDFDDVKKGDLGGFVSNSFNLSQEGNCWLYGNSELHNDSRVIDNAKLYDNASMFNNSLASGNAKIHNDSKMYDYSLITDEAEMFNDSRLYKRASMYDMSTIRDKANMSDNSRMFDKTEMLGNSELSDNAEMHDSSKLMDNTSLCDNASIIGNSVLRGNIQVSGNYVVSEDLYYPFLYSYASYPIYNAEGKKPTHIRMDCSVRTIKEWQENFNNNEEEFPKGSYEYRQRLGALNYILCNLGESMATGD